MHLESRDGLEYDSFKLETVTLSCFGYLIMFCVLQGMLLPFLELLFCRMSNLTLLMYRFNGVIMLTSRVNYFKAPLLGLAPWYSSADSFV